MEENTEIKQEESTQEGVKIENIAPTEIIEAFANARGAEIIDGVPTMVKKDEQEEEKPSEVKSEEQKIETQKEEKTFEQLYEERTGVKWEDSHVEKIKSEIPKPHEYKSEWAKRIEEYVEQGGSEEEFIATQTTNFDQLGEEDLLANRMLLDDSEMTDEEIALEMKIKYNPDGWRDKDEDDMTDADKLNKLKYERDVQKARKDLKEYQKKWAVPINSRSQDQDAKLQAVISEWGEAVDNALKDYNKASFVLGKDTIDFEGIDKKRISSDLNNLVINPTKFLAERYVDSKGNTDLNKMKADMVKLNYFDAILQKAVENAKAQGSKQVVKEMKNATDVKKETKSDAQPKDRFQAAAEYLSSKGQL